MNENGDMIQFRWRPYGDGELHPDLHGYEDNLPVVNINGAFCVLEFRQHFMPTLVSVELSNGANVEIFALEPARDCDTQWKPVMMTPL
jgi:hypothetical protein